MDLCDTDRTQLRLWCHHFRRNRKQGTPGICQPSRRVGWLLEVGRPLCPGRLYPEPPETGPTPRQCSSPLTLLFVCVCVCLPCDIGSHSFPPRETLVVHDAPRMNFQVFASGGAEAVTRVI
ncbi:unnamed protein product [Rangifer tarandus platyrhynchus]|uniref:Uncharacterized protein n=2 Tax=Rangifer tarandus platyrhynchus TaxID=3082113 RepID=A0AC59Z4Y2_RANTA|nr:unnamed protein product [Rangifer tarandus platyrhynchus]